MTVQKLMPLVQKLQPDDMANFLYANSADYCRDSVEWTTTNHPNDVSEIDVWCEDGFVQMFYDIKGKLTRYEIED